MRETIQNTNGKQFHAVMPAGASSSQHDDLHGPVL